MFQNRRKKSIGKVEDLGNIERVVHHLYCTTTRFQVRGPSESSFDICWTNLSDLMTDCPSPNGQVEDIMGLEDGFGCSFWCLSAMAARAPLVGQALVCDKGRRISQADTWCGG